MTKALSIHSTSYASSFLFVAVGFCALPAIGCGNARDGLSDAARGISTHATRVGGGAGRGGREEDGPAGADGGDARDAEESPADSMDDGGAVNDPTPNGATSSDGRKLKDKPAMAVIGPISDDSPRCGNGVLDDDELCEVAIPAGELGACPTECEPLDDCHAAKMEVHSCWSQCVLGDEIPCE